MNSTTWLYSITDQYRKYFGNNAKLIVDVGSRDGDDANWLLHEMNCDAKVICFEARASAAEAIRNRYPDFEVFEAAVSDFTGESVFVQFNEPEFAGSSSLLMARQYAYPVDSEIVMVPVTRLDVILPNEVIDVLKIDVEGNSVPVLRGLGDKISNVLVAHIETETNERAAWGEPANNIEAMQIMQNAGFSLAKIDYQWGWSIQDQTWINVGHERYENDNSA